MQTNNLRILRQETRKLSALPLGAYGLWEATITTRDGRTFLGGGFSEQAALYRAMLRLQQAQGTPLAQGLIR